MKTITLTQPTEFITKVVHNQGEWLGQEKQTELIITEYDGGIRYRHRYPGNRREAPLENDVKQAIEDRCRGVALALKAVLKANRNRDTRNFNRFKRYVNDQVGKEVKVGNLTVIIKLVRDKAMTISIS